jgi:hypothetical protein|tara:strand:+ start:3225 stop:3545 length:321 start_codon:yes stop_codon:yes gene_type:complete
MKKWIGLIALMSLSCSVCADSEYPLLGQLKTRDHLILMVMGPEEPLYTISNNEGEVLVSQRTGAEIKAENMELFALVQELIANQHGKGASFIDVQAEVAEPANADN